MPVPRSVGLTVIAAMAVAAGRAQVPLPSAEPGSVPESQSASPQSAPASARPRVIRVSGGVIAGLKISGAAPVYPPDAKAQGIAGAVVMHAIIDRDGHVENLTVVAGNALLADAALDAVKTWIYKPYLLNGQPTEVDTTITVNFNLGSGPATMPGDPPHGNGGPAAGGQPGGVAGGTNPSALPPRGGSYRPDGPVRISAGVMAGQKLSGQLPVYPEGTSTTGGFVLHIIIGKDGSVKSLEAVHGSPAVTAAAIDAVKDWKYKPYLLNGEPVEVDTTVMISY